MCVVNVCCIVLNTLCLTSAGSQSSSSCTCFMCYYNTVSPTKSKKTKETTFSLCKTHIGKYEHPFRKYFYMSTRATTTTYFSSCSMLCCVVYKFVFIVNMKEQQSNLLECFAFIYVCLLYI